MSKKKKKKKKAKAQSRSLAKRLEQRKTKKALKHGANLFVCESHADFEGACGTKFISSLGWVSCPNCGNPYCRWVNYKEPEEPLVS